MGESIIEENIEPTYVEYLKDLFDKINTVQQKARENLIKSKLKTKEYYDKRINPQNFKTGDLVCTFWKNQIEENLPTSIQDRIKY